MKILHAVIGPFVLSLALFCKLSSAFSCQLKIFSSKSFWTVKAHDQNIFLFASVSSPCISTLSTDSLQSWRNRENLHWSCWHRNPQELWSLFTSLSARTPGEDVKLQIQLKVWTPHHHVSTPTAQRSIFPTIDFPFNITYNHFADNPSHFQSDAVGHVKITWANRSGQSKSSQSLNLSGIFSVSLHWNNISQRYNPS